MFGKGEDDMDFLKAAYMPFVYMIVGILTASAAAVAAPGIYAAHPMLWTLISALLTIPLCIRQMKKNGYFQNEKPDRAGAKEWTLLGILAVAVCIALNYWIELSGLIKIFPGYRNASEILYGGSLIEELLAIALAAPLVEELLFRGLVYRGWKRLMDARMAFVLSAFFFGIYHRNVVQGLYAFLIGLFLVYVYELFETILAPIVFHATANLVSVLMTECLDMEWLKQDVRAELAFTIAFTALGLAAAWLLKKSKRLHIIEC